MNISDFRTLFRAQLLKTDFEGLVTQWKRQAETPACEGRLRAALTAAGTAVIKEAGDEDYTKMPTAREAELVSLAQGIFFLLLDKPCSDPFCVICRLIEAVNRPPSGRVSEGMPPKWIGGFLWLNETLERISNKTSVTSEARENAKSAMLALAFMTAKASVADALADEIRQERKNNEQLRQTIDMLVDGQSKEG